MQISVTLPTKINISIRRMMNQNSQQAAGLITNVDLKAGKENN